MASLDTDAVAILLREYGRRSALRGGNPYRARAYSRAADSLGAADRAAGAKSSRGGGLREISGHVDDFRNSLINSGLGKFWENG